MVPAAGVAGARRRGIKLCSRHRGRPGWNGAPNTRSAMGGKHQRDRADQGREQEEMVVLGVLQCNCELAAEAIERSEQTQQQIVAGIRARPPNIWSRECPHGFQEAYRHEERSTFPNPRPWQWQHGGFAARKPGREIREIAGRRREAGRGNWSSDHRLRPSSGRCRFARRHRGVNRVDRCQAVHRARLPRSRRPAMAAATRLQFRAWRVPGRAAMGRVQDHRSLRSILADSVECSFVSSK